MTRPRGYSARSLVAAMRFAKSHTDDNGRLPVGDFDVMTPTEFRRWFLLCLNRKISRDDPRHGCRRFDDNYHFDLKLDALKINDYVGRRVRQSGSSGLLRTPEMRRRYPHINRQPRED